MFLITLTRVLTMMAYAVPGFLFIKTKAMKPDAISAFAKLLVYVCSPCLTFYSVTRATYSPELNRDIGICFLASLAVTLAVLLILRFALRRKFPDIRWRIFSLATVFGNVGFFGVPLIERLLPDEPNAFIFSEVMAIVMNMVAWTYGLFVISLDRKFMRPQKILTVPNVLAACVAYPMFLFGWSFPPIVTEAIVLLGRMSTPLCMIILGMRLATVRFRVLATDWRNLLAAVLKLTVFPLIVLGVLWLLPVQPYVRASMFLLSCCPCASMILNLSEIQGEGQKSAANAVLIGTLSCIVTIPLMVALFFPA